MDEISGDERLSEIIGNVEENILESISSLLKEQEIISLGEFTSEYIPFLAENPVKNVGIPSGFPKWDKAIAGLRRGSVNVVGARSGVGKSMWCLNIANNVTQSGIPCLYLDTEMDKSDVSIRYTSLLSKVDIQEIETGQFNTNPHLSKIVDRALVEAKSIPLDYVNVSGRKPEEILSLMRRWVAKKVGRDANGQVNDALIILDYLKTMDIEDLHRTGVAEFQYLGNAMTQIHNFSIKHSLPIVVALQLNREAISKNSSDVLAQSDRILWLASSVTILRDKTPEDIAAGDSFSNGNKKLIVIKSRFGSGMGDLEYINIKANLSRAELSESIYSYEATDQAIDNLIDEEEAVI